MSAFDRDYKSLRTDAEIIGECARDVARRRADADVAGWIFVLAGAAITLFGFWLGLAA